MLALIVPRPLYIASATDDTWVEPLGEFLSCLHASPVFLFHGLPGMPAPSQPPPESPVHEGRIGFHLRSGRHDLLAYVWELFIHFANRVIHPMQ